MSPTQNYFTTTFWLLRCATLLLVAGYGGYAGATPTGKSGALYVEECDMAGVPIPPAFNLVDARAGTSEWTLIASFDNDEEFVAQNEVASGYAVTSDEGVCIALPRVDQADDDLIVALGVICQGNATSKACFWDAASRGAEESSSSTFCVTGGCDVQYRGGTDLVGAPGGVCTDCHAGENAFVIHPETGLNLGFDINPDNWVDPIVPASWPQNIGPGNYYIEEDQGQPIQAGSCAYCHAGVIANSTVGDQTIESFSGRMPELSTETPRFCGINTPIGSILPQAANRTMPPGGLPKVWDGYDTWLKACYSPPGAGRVARAVSHHAMERQPSVSEVLAVDEALSAGYSYAEIQELYIRPYAHRAPAPNPPIVDAFEDPVWSVLAPRHAVDTLIEGMRANDEDLSAYWRTLWDETYLYVYISVKDDNVPAWDSGTSPWEDDSVELYLDARDDKNSSYDDNDFQYIFRVGEPDAVHTGGGRPNQSIVGILHAQQLTANGYDVEVAVPWATLGVTPGGRVGIEIHVNDDDGAGSERDAQVSWRTWNTNTWTNPSNMTSVSMIETLSRRIFESEILIDGYPNELDWSLGFQRNLGRTPSPIAASNDTAYWNAIWDEDNLYVFVNVSDFVGTHDSQKVYDDDSVEIFIDANHSHLSHFDGHDDFQLIIKAGEIGMVHFGDQSLAQSTVAIESASVITQNGYSVEVAIPWRWLKAAPWNGRTIGMEVQVNDDDNGGARDGKLSWCSNSNETYRNPSYFCSVKTMGEVEGIPGLPRAPRNNRRFEPGIADPLAPMGVPPTLLFDGNVSDPIWTVSNEARPILEPILDSPTALGEWRGTWNEEFLYIQVSVSADGPPVSDSPAWWQDDSVELFIDANHSRGASFGSQTFQYFFKPGPQFEDQLQRGANSPNAPTNGIKVRSQIHQTGYDMEIAIPWVTLGMLPEPTAQFGIDVHINDDDVDGTTGRVGKLAWFGTALIGDVAWQRPDVLGTVRLLDF